MKHNGTENILKKVIIATLIFHAGTYACEPLNKQTFVTKLLGRYGQSQLVHWFDTYINTKLRKPAQKALGFIDEPASQQYQDLGKEAQQALGIPEEEHLPIKKISSKSPLFQIAAAVAEPDGIYVNEDRLKTVSYGCHRSALFHEAVHVKYHDLGSKTLKELVILIGSTIGVHKCIRYMRPHAKVGFSHSISVLFTGLLAEGLADIKYSRFTERRADIEGFYATQCCVCVQECADRRKISWEVEKNPLRNNGYLCAAEIELIAEELKSDNLRCAYHKDN